MVSSFIRFFIVALCALTAGCKPATHQQSDTLTAGTPAAVQVSEERLQRIDPVLQTGVDSGWVKGVAALIARDGKIVYHKAFGYKEDDTPLSEEAIFRIASQTKAITSVAVMMLFEEGKFLLDDPISRYIPAFANMKVLNTFNPADSTYTTVPAERPITIRHLLTHTSGIDYSGIGSPDMRAIYAKNKIPGVFGSKDLVLKDFVDQLAAMPLVHQPGTDFRYGLNTDVLGRLIEVVSGKTLNEFFHERIFVPLDMQDTYFYLPEDKKQRLVPVHTIDSGKLVVLNEPDENGIAVDYPLAEGTFYSGGAGLSSTLKDYATFLQMLLNNGVYNGQRLLSRRSVELMTSNQIGDIGFRNGNKFGLGFEIFTEQGQLVFGQTKGSFAWGGYFATTYWADPEERVVALIYVNQRSAIRGDLHNKFRAMVYQALDD